MADFRKLILALIGIAALLLTVGCDDTQPNELKFANGLYRVAVVNYSAAQITATLGSREAAEGVTPEQELAITEAYKRAAATADDTLRLIDDWRAGPPVSGVIPSAYSKEVMRYSATIAQGVKSIAVVSQQALPPAERAKAVSDAVKRMQAEHASFQRFLQSQPKVSLALTALDAALSVWFAMNT